MYNLPCGQYERQKSKTVLECAQAELNEEAKLKGGQWIRL